MEGNRNRPLGELRKEDLAGIKMLCFDSDGVTVKKGTDFKDGKMITYELSSEMTEKLKKLRRRFWLNFTSGRNLEFLRQRYEAIKGDNISLQAEIGNFTLYRDRKWEEEWSFGEREKVERVRRLLIRLLKDTRVKGFESKKKIITLHCREEVVEVEKIVRAEDKEEELYCWWNGEAYDIGLKRINKGTALARLVKKLRWQMSQVMTVGNGINDQNLTENMGIDVSTDPKHLQADFVIWGEEAGGEKLVDRILELYLMV